MLSRCWLHIGTGKTGTTSIQYHLARNRDALLAQGYLYPVSPGRGNHHALSAFALEDAKIDATRTHLGIDNAGRLARLRQELPVRLEREIAGKGAEYLILSNEVLAARLRLPAEIARLKQLCDRIAAGTKVIVYLRNQVDYLVGIYTTAILDGHAADFDPRRWAPQADYAAMLARWTSVFGRENVIVRRYEKCDFPEGDVRRDFLKQLGIDPALLARTRYLNRTLDAESIAFIRAFNRRVPAPLAGRIAPLRTLITAVLNKRRGGEKFTVSSKVANRITALFRPSNVHVAALYFPALAPPPLFSSPSCVGDAGSDKPLSWIIAAEMTATLIPRAIFWYFAGLVRRLLER